MHIPVNQLESSEIVIYAVGYLRDDLSHPSNICAATTQDLLDTVGDFKVRHFGYAWERDKPRVAPPGRYPTPDLLKLGRGQMKISSLLPRLRELDTAYELDKFCLEAPGVSGSTEAPDQLVRVTYERAGHVQFAHMHGRVHFGMNTAVSEQLPTSVVAGMFRRFFELLDATGECFYGLVDVTHVDEIRGGLYYGSIPLMPMAWHREIEHFEWLFLANERLNRVRGNYWGTYLGPEMSRRVNADGRFVEHYLEYCRSGIVKPQTAERFAHGGVYLTLSSEPMDMCHPILGPVEWCWENALWLREQFRKAGLLGG